MAHHSEVLSRVDAMQRKQLRALQTNNALFFTKTITRYTVDLQGKSDVVAHQQIKQ